MADPVRVMVNGACGRMGGAVIRLIAEQKDIRLTAALERPGHPYLGQDVGEIHEFETVGVRVTSELQDADVLIDFSAPASAAARATECAKRGVGMVIGTTGLDASHMEVIRRASERVPCLHSSNMSLGIALATKAVATLAKNLPELFDVEIVETHHKYKKDSPSGTALRLAYAISRARDESGPTLTYGRHGMTDERKIGEIGVHSLRMGEETGEHRVIFSGPGESIEIRHVALNREAFARGALLAARFVHGRKPGIYDISDVFLPG